MRGKRIIKQRTNIKLIGINKDGSSKPKRKTKESDRRESFKNILTSPMKCENFNAY